MIRRRIGYPGAGVQAALGVARNRRDGLPSEPDRFTRFPRRIWDRAEGQQCDHSSDVGRDRAGCEAFCAFEVARPRQHSPMQKHRHLVRQELRRRPREGIKARLQCSFGRCAGQ